MGPQGRTDNTNHPAKAQATNQGADREVGADAPNRHPKPNPMLTNQVCPDDQPDFPTETKAAQLNGWLESNEDTTSPTGRRSEKVNADTKPRAAHGAAWNSTSDSKTTAANHAHPSTGRRPSTAPVVFSQDLQAWGPQARASK